MSAFESIATISVGSNTPSVSFTSISSAYQHLQIRGFIRTGRSSAAGYAWIEMNDQPANTAYYSAFGASSASVFGVSASGNRGSGYQIVCPGAGVSSVALYGSFVMDLYDYANTSKLKTARIYSGFADTSSGSSQTFITSFLWKSTSAVNKITFGGVDNTDVIAGTKIGLYGIRNA